MQSEWDVVIAGGGMAGASLALALSRFAPALRVMVVEAVALPATTGGYQPSYDGRSTALSWGTRLIFEDLDVWSRLAPRATPIRQVHVSDRGRLGSSRLDAAEHAQDALGYVVDNRWLGQQLMAALQGQPVFWCCPAQVCHAEPAEDGVTLTIDHAGITQTCHTRLLVVADGGRSGLSDALGFVPRTHAYGQHALVANVSTAKSHDFVAYERFTTDGPIAMLPRGDIERAEGECALVWTLADAEVPALMALSESALLDCLQTRFGWRLGRFLRMGERQIYPLQSRVVPEPVRAGVALVGNAAHALHPVAGQGFNLAIRGLMTLAALLVEAQARGQSPGDLAVLQRYACAQQPDQQRILQLSGGLIALFGQTSAGWATLRDAGLLGLDLLPAARHWFTRQTMGLEGDRPLARLMAGGSRAG